VDRVKQAGIIGYPLGHSLSPAIHNAAYEAMGLDVHYEAWSTPPEDVGAAVARLRDEAYLGMNVTVPHKQAVVEFLDEVDETARKIGAVNTIVKQRDRLVGHNTDRAGYLRGLVEAGFNPKGKSVLIIGYGGAERAVAYALAEAGATSIAIAGRRTEAIAEAVEHLRATSPWPMNLDAVEGDERSLVYACQGADLIVNCTSVGMRHSPTEGSSPIPGHLINRGHWVSDVVYNPLETELLRQAREAGATVVAGLDMLVYQAAEAIELWTGQRAPVDVMREAAMVALGLKE
jgi:shikimate dehydrogenase